MSRVDSVKVGAMKAVLPLAGSIVASDAFFPFPDGVEEAAKHGITAVIQPGGSVNDNDVIAAADRLGFRRALSIAYLILAAAYFLIGSIGASWLAPVVCADDFDDVSALRASIADDAAPRAKSMVELQRGRTDGGRQFVRVRVSQQAPCHAEKPNKTGLSRIHPDPRSPAIAARSGRFFRPQESEAGRIAPGPPACYAGPFRPLRGLGKRTCLSNLRRVPSSSRRRSWRRISPNWAKKSAPWTRQAPTGSIST
jgi:hypothetical protein